MKKYIKAKELLETKANKKEKKPIYATRKLSIGLVSCMLGLVMATPVVHAEEEGVNLPIPQSEEPAVGEENQPLEPAKVEPVTEEVLTESEIKEIEERALNLGDNKYVFTSYRVKELKERLLKIKAENPDNFDQLKKEAIDKAIIEFIPKQRGEEKAHKKLRNPTIDPVSPGSKIITGGGAGQLVVDGNRVYATVYVSLVDSEGNEKAKGQFTRKNSSLKWTVTLDKPAAVGDKVIAYNKVGDTESERIPFEVKKLLADEYKDKLKMPTGEIWIEQYVANIVNDDEKAEALQKLKDANPSFANDIDSVKFEIRGTDENKVAYYTVTYTDGSTSEEIVATDLKIIPVKDTSRDIIVDDVYVGQKTIKGKINKGLVKPGTKIYIKYGLNQTEENNFCKDGNCKIDKETSESLKRLQNTEVNPNGTFEFSTSEDFKYGTKIGFILKEPNKFRSCTYKSVKLLTPKKVEVRDPHKLTDADKKAIDKAIREANTVNGTSKMPDGTGFIDDPAFIEFDKDGNVRIISPNDVEVEWDAHNNPVYQKNDDKTYKLKKGKENNVIKMQVKDLVKNIGPDAPTIKETDDKKHITVNPISNKDDTDIIEHTVTYTGTDGKEKKIVAKQDLEIKKWSIESGSEFASLNESNGLITIDKLKIKNDTEVKAFVKDNGEYTNNEDKRDSTESIFKVTKTKADQVTELGGLDPVDITKNVGDKVDWKDGVKAKESAKPEDKTKIDELLKEATFTDTTDKKRTTKTKGEIVGKISVKFDDGSEIVVEDQKLIVKEKTIKVKVTYDANGGEGNMDGAELDKGAKYNLLDNGFTAPANKEFAGWKIGDTEYKPGAEITVNENTTVTAIWKEKPGSGGSTGGGTKPNPGGPGEVTPIPTPIPTPEPGDNPADQANPDPETPQPGKPNQEKPEKPGENPEKPVDKEPGKEKDKNEEGKKPGVEDRLRIRYNPNGGHWNDNSTDILTYYYDRGNIITLINPPTREGYRFLYWKGSAYQPGVKYTVVDDHMFVAQWEKIGTKASRSNPKTGIESVAGVVCTLVASTGALYIGRKKED